MLLQVAAGSMACKLLSLDISVVNSQAGMMQKLQQQVHGRRECDQKAGKRWAA
jgi:hypothetical protein